MCRNGIKKAQEELGYYLDDDSDIEVMADEYSVNIRTEEQMPYFATFQIVSIGNDENKELQE